MGFLDLQGLAADLGLALLHSVWQVALVALALWGLLTLLHRAAPGLRHNLALGALALAVIWPASTFRQARVDRGGRIASIARGPRFIQPNPAPPRLTGVKPGFPARVIELSKPALPWLALLWGAGVIALGFRLMGGWLWLQRLRQSTEMAPEWVLDLGRNLARRMRLRVPSLRISEAVAGPFSYGLWRTIVVLPVACLGQMDARDLEALLAHEFAHLRRHDFLLNALQSIAELLLFHHPLARWISATVRLERERCCDLAAVSVCGDALFYSAVLDRLDDLRPVECSFLPPPSRASASLALPAQGAPLMIRIRHLLGVNSRPSLPALFGAVLVLTGLCLAAVAPFRDGLKGPAILVPAALLKQVDEAAKAEGLDPDLIRAMIQCESRYDPKALSAHGSIGLMQVMPQTAARFGITDPWKVDQNLLAGTKYMRFLMDRYNGDTARAVMAYNAGEIAMDKSGNVAPAEETRLYSKAVLDLYREKAVQPTEGSSGVQAIQGRLSAQPDGSWRISIHAWMMGKGSFEVTQGGERLALLYIERPEQSPYFAMPAAAIQPMAGKGPLVIRIEDLGSKRKGQGTVPLAAGDFMLELQK